MAKNLQWGDLLADEIEGPEGMKMGGLHYEVEADYAKFDDALVKKQSELSGGSKETMTFERGEGEGEDATEGGLMTANKSKSIGLLKSGMGAAVVPVTIALVGLKKVFEKSEAFKMMKEGLSDFFGALGDTLLVGLVLFVKHLWDKLTAFAGWLYDNAENFWNWIKGGASQLWEWLSTSASTLWDWLSGAPASLWDWISSGVSDLWGWLSAGTAQLWEWLSGGIANIGALFWNFITEGPGDMVGSFFAWLKKGGAIPLWDWLKEGTHGFWDWLKAGPANLWHWLTEGGTSLATKLWNWLKGGITGIGETVYGWITRGSADLWNWLTSGISNAGEKLWEWLTKGAEGLGSKVKEWLGGGVDKVKKAVDDGGSWWGDRGQDLHDLGDWMGL